MSRYVLDTSAYSRLHRGNVEVADLIGAADWIGMPSVVLGELWLGFLLGSRLRENDSYLREFLADPIVEELTIDARVARAYAEIAADLRRAGTPLPDNDIWIAACAAASGASVLTYDQHFRHIRRIGAVVLT